MKIYIDSDFKCYTSNDGTMRAVETQAFDGKCKTFIEGYRYIPAGENWIRSDGVIFQGEMISPWKDYAVLYEVQSLYEETLADKERISALEEGNLMLTECILELSEMVYA